MTDRNVQFPNRYRLVPVEGATDIVDLIPAPGNVEDEGTLLNKANLLSDETAARLGGVETPNEAIATLREWMSLLHGGSVILLTTHNTAGAPCTANVNVSPATLNGEEFSSNASGILALFVNPGTYQISLNDDIFSPGGSGPKTIQVGRGEIIQTNLIGNVKTAGDDYGMVTESGNLRIPLGLRGKMFDFTVVGGGGSGAVYRYYDPYNGIFASGAGGGYTNTVLNVVIDYEFLRFTIGSGGAAVTVSQNSRYADGLDGGTTSISPPTGSHIIVANGGKKGTSTVKNDKCIGGSGGSGGGTAIHFISNDSWYAYSGASDGAGGGDRGSGQGKTTRAWEDPKSNILFSGAGGAATYQEKGTYGLVEGAGGAGGGSRGKVAVNPSASVKGNDATFYGGGSGGTVAHTNQNSVVVTGGAGYQGCALVRWHI